MQEFFQQSFFNESFSIQSFFNECEHKLRNEILHFVQDRPEEQSDEGRSERKFGLHLIRRSISAGKSVENSMYLPVAG
jgi:uncharacterized protein (DUF1786 family)